MSWQTAWVAVQAAILFYFALALGVSLVLAWRGLRSLLQFGRETRPEALQDLVERGGARPISILVPARNEAKTIVESVRSLLELQFPEFEIIVISDGSTDGTLTHLREAFDLEEHARVYPRSVDTKPIGKMYRSSRFPELTVVAKKAGGKADALNVGLNLAKFPLVCTLDADSLVEGDALLRASRIFANDERVVAVGGALRPLNGATVEAGRVVKPGFPKRWIERIQLVEYARSFGVRAGWGSWNALLLVSGAFGIFRRESVLAVGGYRTTTVAEDLDLVVRLHRHARENRLAHRIVSLGETMCWTQVPSDWGSLRRQRNRWQRGLWEVLWSNRGMVFRPSMGRLGMVALPFTWLFEGLGPLVEVGGYLLIPIAIVLGILDPWIGLSLLVFAVASGMVLSCMGIVHDSMRRGGELAPLRQQRLLILAAALELVGYRQLLVLERLFAFFQIARKEGKWGRIERESIASGSSGVVVELPPTRPEDEAPGQEAPDDGKARGTQGASTGRRS